MNQSTPDRILAVSLSSRGFGYAVMEGANTLVDYGHKVFNEKKNARSLVHVEKLIVRNQPDVLVLCDVKAKGTFRAARIKKLHQAVIALAKKRKLKRAIIPTVQLRSELLGNPKGTKYEMAEMLAKQFSNKLASRLPPKRKFWKSEDSRMDTFDATALAVVYRLEKGSEEKL